MPVHRAPGHDDCWIECPGDGSAQVIPPFRCVKWCADVGATVMLDAIAEEIAQQGWQFQSALSGRWTGATARDLAHRMLHLPRRPPEETQAALQDVEAIGAKSPALIVPVAWPLVPFTTAVALIARIFQDASRNRRGDILPG